MLVGVFLDEDHVAVLQCGVHGMRVGGRGVGDDAVGHAARGGAGDKAARLGARIPAQAADGADQKNINPILRAKPTGGGDPTVTENADWLRDALTK